MLKIGITACLLYPDAQREFFAPKTLCYLEKDMASYLMQESVLPLLIPAFGGEPLQAFLEAMDGFVFQGGTDLSPQTYGEPFLDEQQWPGDPQRDEYELQIMDFAFRHAKPVYGICRGAQLINAYFQGTLFQDLDQQCEKAGLHKNKAAYDRWHHGIEFSPEGHLAELFAGIAHPQVNSIHHQGIKTLGNDLVVEAVAADDGLIEAFSYKNLEEKFILGVQWHPEFSHTLGAAIIPAEPLYAFFLQAVADKNKKH